MTDYKGSPSRCKVWIAKLKEKGAGFKLASRKHWLIMLGYQMWLKAMMEICILLIMGEAGRSIKTVLFK